MKTNMHENKGEGIKCLTDTTIIGYVVTLMALILWTNTYAQKPVEELVYKTIMDTLLARHEVEFYCPSLQHIETQGFSENPMDSIIVFDPETFEDVKKSNLDIVIESDSINLVEARLFKQRVNYPNGLYIISKIKSSQLHRNITLQDYIDLESYPKMKDLPELSGSILRGGSIGPYATMPSSMENVSIYKYAIKAYLSFSGVLWDKTNNYCLVECGCHYMVSVERPGTGPSGGGFLVIMKNENETLRIIKFIGLWEE